ncbi:TVP38/TMEM64 family protein [Candidatus Dependentiae bacterium]
MIDFNNHKSKIILAIIIVGLVIVLRFIGIGEYTSLESIKANKEYLVQLVSQNYVLSIVIYLAIFTVASFFSLPITIALNLFAGFFYGVFWGALLVNIGTTLGCTLAFLTFRYLLRDFVLQKHAAKMKNFNEHVAKYGYSYLLSAQIFPATPMFLINLFSGLSSVTLWTFIWTTSLGILPGSLVYVFAGQQLTKIESARDILSLPIISALVLLGLLSLLPVIASRLLGNNKR